jgi:hypothetical protein
MALPGATTASAGNDLDCELPLSSRAPVVLPKLAVSGVAVQGFQDEWRARHPDWEYRLWRDEESRELLATHYAWFLPTFCCCFVILNQL